jgi:hypothetical protein
MIGMSDDAGLGVNLSISTPELLINTDWSDLASPYDINISRSSGFCRITYVFLRDRAIRYASIAAEARRLRRLAIKPAPGIVLMIAGTRASLAAKDP